MARYRKLSIALLLYTTILWICQMSCDVTADGTTALPDRVPGITESRDGPSSNPLDRPDDHIQDSTSSTGDSLGFYQKYKQFVAKHNKTFTIVFGVLFVISLVVAIGVYAGCDKNEYQPIPILLGIGIFGFVLYKLYGHKVLAYFRSKKVPLVKDTVDTVDSST
ncbi:uncharacterized protein BBOV_IV000330 [Babesia bovis T2Bo]|uniref:Membrane protein, putative n=1 Tax=Babesia bovis TaxID=5865 RepID=A7AV07_BABBO|nr:uncharacterized protein BBOV_IV000330 [Babesia bovis T2Bo]EDO05633.1 putative integral membrane protein [Babesia bovis T2Bo]|eukprot:XP_001609201.1 hypothetical protein [Babesia bovis T2Bo]